MWEEREKKMERRDKGRKERERRGGNRERREIEKLKKKSTENGNSFILQRQIPRPRERAAKCSGLFISFVGLFI